MNIGSFYKLSGRLGQRGVAALAVALAVLIVSSVVTVGIGQIGVNEQKTVANQTRSEEARAIAEAGLGRGTVFLRENGGMVRSTTLGSPTSNSGWMNSSNVRWAACTSTATAPPCGNGRTNVFDNNWTAYANVPNLMAGSEAISSGSFATHFVTRAVTAGSAAPGEGVYYVVSQGLSGDQGGSSLMRRGFLFRPFIANRPDAPLIAAGTIATTGALSVVANPNGGGQGVPISAWSGDNATLAGAMQTCHVAEYLSTNSNHTLETDSNGDSVITCPACACPNAASRQISNSGVEGIDILDDDGDIGANPDTTNFPDDVFQYVFGEPETEYLKVKEMAKVINSCAGLGPTSSGLMWINGTCDIPSNTRVGSLQAPLILVIENGSFRMNANGEFFGLIFAFAQPAGGGSVNVQINGGPTLYGSLISNRNIDLGNGNYTARYDRAVLDNLSAGGPDSNRVMAEVPGTWKDY